MRFMKYFLSTSFKEQVLGLLLIFHGESFLRGMDIWTPQSTISKKNVFGGHFPTEHNSVTD